MPTLTERPSLDYLKRLPLTGSYRAAIEDAVAEAQAIIDALLPGSYIALVTPEPPKL